MIRMQDLGEIGYGGVVTLTNWWDQTRIEDGRLQKKEILKKASFWAYLGIGLPATLVSAFGWWRRGENWMEHISHGFLYGLPGFVFDMVQSLRATSAGAGTNSDAVRKASEILRRKQMELAGRDTRALGQGAGMVMPGEVPVTDYQEILA